MTPEQIEEALRVIADQNKLTFLEVSLVAGGFEWGARGVADKAQQRGSPLSRVLQRVHAAREARRIAIDGGLRAD